MKTAALILAILCTTPAAISATSRTPGKRPISTPKSACANAGNPPPMADLQRRGAAPYDPGFRINAADPNNLEQIEQAIAAGRLNRYYRRD